jgi:hypothetical protein
MGPTNAQAVIWQGGQSFLLPAPGTQPYCIPFAMTFIDKMLIAAGICSDEIAFGSDLTVVGKYIWRGLDTNEPLPITLPDPFEDRAYIVDINSQGQVAAIGFEDDGSATIGIFSPIKPGF